jgi:hypothetical protein
MITRGSDSVVDFAQALIMNQYFSTCACMAFELYPRLQAYMTIG